MARSGATWIRQQIALVVAALAAALLLSLGACSSDKGGDGGTDPGAPEIEGIVAVPPVVARGGQTQLTALASDPDGDSLSYHWSAEAGTFSNPVRARIRWTAPTAAGTYRIMVQVSAVDGTVRDTLDLMVGSGAIRVTSTPPGSEVYLNASLQSGQTPIVYRNLPSGDYNVELASPWFLYDPPATVVTVVDGETASASFALPPIKTETIGTGNTPFDEIGSFSFTEGGLGVVFTGRSGSSVTLRSSSLVPVHQGQNGTVLMSGVTLDEPLTLRIVPFGSELAFVADDDIFVGHLIDADIDGLSERLDSTLRLNGLAGSGYAPAFSTTGDDLAFALMPSTPPNGGDLILEGHYDSAMVSSLHRISSRTGNSPSFAPNGSIVFEAGGELCQVFVDTLNPAPGQILTSTGGHAHAPAVSPSGDYIAYIDDRGRLEILVPHLMVTTTLLSDVHTGRVVWGPNGRELVIADNAPGGPARLLLLSELPFP